MSTPATSRLGRALVSDATDRAAPPGAIAQALFITEVTAKSHIDRTFTKLALSDRDEAILFTRPENGLVAPR